MKTLDEAIAQLERDPRNRVIASVRGLAIEIRALPPGDEPPARTAREAFERLGPWEGETQEQIVNILREGRMAGASTNEPPRL